MAEELTKLRSVLGEDLNSLTDSAKSKLESHLKNQCEDLEQLRAEIAHLKAISERSQFQFEKELLESQSRFKDVSDDCHKAKSQVTELEEKLKNSQNELKNLRTSHNSTAIELQTANKKCNKLSEENKELAEQLDKRRNDIEKLNGEIKQLSDTLTSANEAKYETLTKIEEIQLHGINLEHQMKRLQQEKEILNEQLSSLNEEIVQKGQEILTLRREKSTFVIELQSELEQVQDELQATQKQSKEMKKTIEEKDKRIEHLAKQVKEVKESQVQSEEQFLLELHAQTKLADLYKKSSTEAQERVNELMRAIEEMHKLLQETNEGNSQLEEKFKDCNTQWSKELEEKKKEITNLKEELKNVNDVLTKNRGLTEEGLEKLFPTAAATSRILHSGMTLTQIYSEYIKSQEEVQKEKTENQRLTQQLQQIVAEIEEKTPLVNQRFTEYQKALETICCLRNQLANSLTDQEMLQSERDDAKRISTHLQNENQRLKQQVMDTSKQVCVLLREVEEARGGQISSHTGSMEEMVSSSDETNADTVISKHLVTFRNIEELQSKNQQLLAVVRDLSDNQEKIEKTTTEEKTSELRQELENAMAQLKELQKERTKQTELVESIIRQRDMYRVLLSQHQAHPSIFTSSALTSISLASPGVSPHKDEDSSLRETKVALNQLQKEFDVYKKEKTANTQILNEQLDKLREEVSELRIQNAKLTSQLEYSEERFNLLQSNADMFKREAATLREKNQKHTANITQHQHTINSLRQEVMATQEKLSKAEVTVENLRAERDILKSVETRLLQEKESLIREQQKQSHLVANLQAVQNNLEKLESDTHNYLKNQIAKLEKECEVLKSKLEGEKEQYSSSIRIWERQAQELQQKLEKEVQRSHKTHDELVEAYAHIHELKQEATANNARLAAAESQLAKNPAVGAAKTRAAATEMKKVKDQLAELQNEIKKMQEKLNFSEKNKNHYSTLASELETQLKEQTELNSHLKEGMEKTLKEKEEIRVTLEQRIEECEKQCRQLIDENVHVTEESTNKAKEFKKEISTLQRDIEAARKQAEEAIKNEQQARNDCKAQAKLVQEAQEKYERELFLHVQDVQKMHDEKEELVSCKSKIEEYETKVNQLGETISENQSSWEEREKMLQNELEVLKQKCEDLGTNNNRLLDQIELLGSQMAAVQSKDWDIPSAPLESDDKSTQQLLEVIRFLRREKEISIAQSESLQIENLRIKTQLECLKTQIKELQETLANEQAQTLAKASTEAKHAALMKKIEMLNILSESNQLLRSEKESSVQTQDELRKKIEQMEKDSQPVKELNAELSSQVDALSAENIALRGEVKRWQTRTNQLLEQTHKMGPEDYKQLSKENENLHKQIASLTEELYKKQAELSLINSSLSSAKKELESLKTEILKEKSQTGALQEQIKNVNKECADHQKNLLQVKRIARKYKTQHDELKKQYDQLVVKEALAAEANVISNQDNPVSQEMYKELEEKLKQSEEKLKSTTEEMQKMEEKLKEYEEKVKSVSEEMEKVRETLTNAVKEGEMTKNDALQKEERARKVMYQAKQRINLLSSQKESLMKEKENFLTETEELKLKISVMEQSSGEELQRINSLKSHYETKITAIEKELTASKENSEKLEKQIEELTQKISQQRQASKPSTSAGPVDRGSLLAEPLTANIKPLAPPVQPCVTTLTMRHPSHSHTVTTLTRTTPTASIRPIAIGTVSTSVTVPSQTRMAAVLPTSATPASTTPSTSEEEVCSIASPTSSQLSPALPQATVQPTPTIPTATVTSVVVIGDTPSAAIAPTTHTIISSHESSSVICMSEAEKTITQQELPPVSAITPSVAPVTALVSPRVEVSVISEDTSDQTESTDTTASPSVIVSPSGFSSGTSNVTQTQVVVPTVKRPRDELSSHSDSSDHVSSLPQVKRIRVKSEGSQTIQQLTPDISEPGPSSINIAVVVSQPVNIESVAEKKSDTSTIVENVPPEQERTTEQETLSARKIPVDQIIEETVPSVSSSTKLKISADEEEVIIVESDDEKPKDESYDEQDEGEDFNDGEDMDDDEGDDDGPADDYEDQQMQEIGYSQVDDDEMSNEQFETENMSEQATDEVEVVVLDDPDDNQMDAQDTSQAGAPVHLIPTEPVQSVVPPCTSASTEIPAVPSRPLLLPRITSRSECLLPAVVRHLSFTITGQPPGYEEGGDSIVPSTPTLFVPHRGDGFAEAVSSPHVPHDRFVFNSATDIPSSQQPLSQLATQSSLSVDDTRMDLSQFDDGSGRSVPTTPLQVSPPDDVSITQGSDSVNMEQSTITTSPTATSSAQTIPMITITEDNDVIKPGSSDASVRESDTPVIQIIDVCGNVTDSEIVQEVTKESTDASQELASSGPIIEEVTSVIGEESSNEAAPSSVIEADNSDVEQTGGETEAEKNTEASAAGSQTSQARKPIIWDDSGSNAPVPSSSQQAFTTPTTSASNEKIAMLKRTQQQQQQQQQPQQQQPQQPLPPPPHRSTRGRKIRLRGSSSFSSPRGSGSWGGRRGGRGGPGRGMHTF